MWYLYYDFLYDIENNSLVIVHETTSSEDEYLEDVNIIIPPSESPILSRDGKVTYSRLPPTKTKNRAKDICKFTPGLNFKSKRILDELDAFMLFINDSMIEKIVNCSNAYATDTNISTRICKQDMIRWIGINLFFGLTKSKNMNLNELWGDRYGSDCIKKSMPLYRFNMIKRILRFDVKSNRNKNNKLAPFEQFFEKFSQNLQCSYVPSEHLTVDEQLVTYRGRCSFKVYMPSKPGKYGIKLWTVCDAMNGFVCNAQIYIGKVGLLPEKNQGRRVALDLCGPFLNRGRTVTCDNFFTSYDLALELIKKKTCLVGTVRKSRVFLPVSFQRKKIPLAERDYIFNESVTILNFGDKKDKSVVLLSTMHNEISEVEGKPEIVAYYNQTKCGVDLADQVIRNYSCKRGTRRWPLCLFFNCLDMAAYNAYVIFRTKYPGFQAQHKKNARREFLYNLSKLFMEYSDDLIERENNPNSAKKRKSMSSFTNDRKRCHLCPSNPGTKSQMICYKCEKAICKNHCVVYCDVCQ